MNNSKLITQDVLKLLGISTIIIGTTVIPSLPAAVAGAVKIWRNINRKDLGRIITRLEKQQMINIREDNGQTMISITGKGKHRLLEYDLENFQIKTKKLDGKWRLVIFDIPELRKPNREAFRNKLTQLGLVRLQDSVFVSAYPCQKEIDFLCHYYQISDYVTIVVVDKIERGQQLIFQKYSSYDD